MRTKSGHLIAFALIFLLIGLSPAYADWGDWTPGGEAVCTAGGWQDSPSVVSDGSGGVYVAWADERGGMANSSLYLQRVDEEGNALWTVDGISIENDVMTIPAYNKIQLVPDGSGGVVIVFQSESGTLLAQRVDASGNLLWTGEWFWNAVDIFREGPELNWGCVDFNAISDGSGGIIVTWSWEWREGFGHPYEHRVSAQRVNSSGSLLWGITIPPREGLVLHSDTTTASHPQLTSDGAGGAIVSWHASYFNIKAAKVDSDGNILWNVTVNLGSYLIVDADRNTPQVVSDGSGGAIISWNHRVTFAYDHHWWLIYAQKIDQNGNQQWASDVLIAGIYPTDADHCVISDGAGGAIYTFGSKDPSPPIIQEFKWLWIQRIGSNGDRMWGTDGILVADLITLYKKEFSAASDGNGGVIAAWSDARLPGNRDIYVQRISAGGVEEWTDGGLPICTVSSHQSRPAVAYHGNEGVVVVWSDPRNDAGDIYAQRIDNCFLDISNVNVNATFDAQTYTWDAEFTFDTNLPATAAVHYDPTMDCFPPCAYSQQQSGPEATNHSIVLTDLPASTTYCYKVTAEAAGDPSECLPEATGSFTLDNAYNEIYGIVATHLELNCQIRVRWYSKFPSRNNALYWRELGAGGWNTLPANQDDCEADRLYSAKFNVSPGTYYEYKVSTEIDGIEYMSSVYQKRAGRCDEDPPKPFEPVSPNEITEPFLRAHPNPFNPQTTVSFNLPSAMDIDLKIYSANGAYVTTLASGTYAKGIHHVQWNVTSKSGEEVSSGIYFARLRMGAEVLTSKLLLLK